MISTGLSIPLIPSRFCSRKVDVELLFPFSWISLHLWGSIINIWPILLLLLVLTRYKLLRLQWRTWWDMRELPCRVPSSFYLLQLIYFVANKFLACRYVDPNDPTKIFLQQPTPESQLRRRTYYSQPTENSY